MLHFEDLSIEELNKKIELLNNELITLNELNSSYSLEKFSSMQEQEIRQILEKYGLEKNFKELQEYFSLLFLFKEQNIYSQFTRTLDPIREKANNIILNINNAVRIKLEAARKHNEEISKQIFFCSTLKKYLEGEFKHTKEDYDNLTSIIIQSNMTPNDKVKLSLILSKKLIEIKQKNVEEVPIVVDKDEREYTPGEIASFEESLIENKEKQIKEENISEFRREQIALANEKYDKYKEFISGSSFNDPKEIYGLLDLEYISENGYLLDDFAIYLVISVSAIKDLSLSDEEIKKYVDILQDIDKRYIKTRDIHERILEEERILESIKKRIEENDVNMKRLFSLSNALGSNLEQDIFDVLMQLQHKLEVIKQISEKLKIGEIRDSQTIQIELNILEEKLDEINKRLSVEIANNNGLTSTEIRTFILFDADDQSKKSFIHEDLLGDNPFIDINATTGNYASEEDRNYQQNISKLIGDLMLFGESEYMHSINSSSSNYGDKIEGIIYKSDDKGNVLRDEKTPLWRIRPTPRSNIRFIERKVIISPNSELFTQVKGIIQKHLPKTIIPENENFVMMVNLGCAIKRSDTEIYNIAYKRFKERDVRPLSIFYENGNYGSKAGKSPKIKNRLTEEECQLLDAYVSSSLQVLYEMSKEEPLYNFDFIDRMGGEKEYGLQ